MTYTKQNTPGIILKSFDRREADRAYVILTRNFGLVYADASGVRAETSKLRGALQDFSYSEITLIRARDRWRITDASVVLNTWQSIKESEKRALLGRMFHLVDKLVETHQEEEELFDALANAVFFLAKTRMTREECNNLEVLLALRVLRRLGYLGESASLEHVIASPFINDIHLFEAGRLRRRALSEINRSMREIQF